MSLKINKLVGVDNQLKFYLYLSQNHSTGERALALHGANPVSYPSMPYVLPNITGNNS